MRRVRYANAFTLVELIAVIVVLAVLGAVAVPKFFDHSQKAKASTIAASLKVIKRAVLQYRMNNSAFPPDQNGGLMPPELEPYLSNNAWIMPIPGVGMYNWEGPPGWANTEAISVAVTSAPADPLTDPLFLAVDKILDDNDLSTGMFVWHSGSGRYVLKIDMW